MSLVGPRFEHVTCPFDPCASIGTLQRLRSERLGGRRSALAIVGIYGVLSHAVTRRTQEIGIRMAVGAVPSQVLAMILRQSLVVTGTGAAVGLLMAAGTTRYLESMLFELTPLDPWTFVAVAVMALVVAVLAAYPAAARASRVDPLAALRHDWDGQPHTDGPVR